MKPLNAVGVALAAMLALGTITSSALSATVLPDISVALGGKYPLHLNFADNGKTPTDIESTSGSKLTGEGLSLSLSVQELSASGTFEAAFLNVAYPEGKSKCHSTGDTEGEVLVSGEFHIVPIAEGGDGVLFSPKEVAITCGTVKVKVKGSVLSTLSTAEGELTEGDFTFEGSKGKNTLTKYFNNEGKEVEAKLEANFGSGFVQAAEVLGEEITATASEGKMFEVKPPPEFRAENEAANKNVKLKLEQETGVDITLRLEGTNRVLCASGVTLTPTTQQVLTGPTATVTVEPRLPATCSALIGGEVSSSVTLGACKLGLVSTGYLLSATNCVFKTPTAGKPNCEIKVNMRNDLGSVTYRNTPAAPKDIQARIEANGTAYTTTACGLANGLGTFEGKVIIKGEEPAGTSVGVEVR